MVSSPMYFPPSPFEREEALNCATLVGTAYDMYAQWVEQHKPQPEQFNWKPNDVLSLNYSKPIWVEEKFLKFFYHSEPLGFVAWSDRGTAYLVFRGTDSAEDWIEDVEVGQEPFSHIVPNYGKVHRGFYGVYLGMKGGAIATLDQAVPKAKRLFITGHSLGSGLSTLAVPDVIAHTQYQPDKLPIKHYNFASPKVGNLDFATAYNQNKVPTYRLVNTCDLVPDAPLSLMGRLRYQHIGIPVDFTAQYGTIAGNHNLKNAYEYALNNYTQPQSHVS
ncbi:MAG: lipase family protein [Cyanobacteriota bacterium]|nr:lipase family protein [Cyanobacteriota bacterium]